MPNLQRKGRLIGVTVLMLFAGLWSEQKASADSTPRYFVDASRLSTQQQGLAVAAMANWESATSDDELFTQDPDAPVTGKIILVDEDDRQALMTDDESALAYTQTTGSGVPDKATITLYQSHIDAAFPKSAFAAKDDYIKVVLTHEFGHALGLRHVSNKRDIMYPSTVSTDQQITQYDLKMLPWAVSNQAYDGRQTNWLDRRALDAWGQTFVTLPRSMPIVFVLLLATLFVFGMLLGCALWQTPKRRPVKRLIID
jgi:hypothetical protein